MNRLIMPFLLVFAAIGLFVVYTNPAYQTVKSLEQTESSYDDALNKSQELRTLRDQLLARRNTFSPDDLSKLQEILPDNVDNIRLIIDINNIAARHNLSLKNVELGDVSNSSTATNSDQEGQSTDPTGSVTLGFTVSATYDDFQAFLADLEHSLRVVDVEKLNFSVGQTAATDYTMTIRTYWLR